MREPRSPEAILGTHTSVKNGLVTPSRLCHIRTMRWSIAVAMLFLGTRSAAAQQAQPAPQPLPPQPQPYFPQPGQPQPYPQPGQPQPYYPQPQPGQPQPYPQPGQPQPQPGQPQPYYPQPQPVQPRPYYPQPQPGQPQPYYPQPGQPQPGQAPRPQPFPQQPAQPVNGKLPLPGATTRGALQVNVPPKKAGLPEVRVELEGRMLSRELYGRPMLIAPGPRLIRVAAIDEAQQIVLGPRQELVQIQAGYTSYIDVPEVERTSNGGLLAGGVVVATLGLAATTFAGMSFEIADEATACTGEGWASDACGAEPGPWIGVGVTSLIFGLSGLIGGTVMIVNGATPELSWVPRVNAGTSTSAASATATWQF